jgi:biofilm PGA synthesis N-glycosyltransferase PgaC
VTAIAAIFWASVGLLVYAQLGYPLLLAVLARIVPARPASPALDWQPVVSLIAAAHDEEAVIGAKVANALALDWSRERLEVIVAADGCGRCRAGARPRRQDSCPRCRRSRISR